MLYPDLREYSYKNASEDRAYLFVSQWFYSDYFFKQSNAFFMEWRNML